MLRLIAQPWWVNLLGLVPIVAYFLWRGRRVPLASGKLMWSGVFAAAFGVVEGMVVVYLRAVAGLLPGYRGAGSDITPQLPQSLLTLEVFREAATIIMLLSVALLSCGTPRARAAVFLWVFAIWDIIYYATLWATIRWPVALSDPDVLFLIPVPWLSPVWFPLLVSGLAVAAVLLTRDASTPASQQRTGA